MISQLGDTSGDTYMHLGKNLKGTTESRLLKLPVETFTVFFKFITSFNIRPLAFMYFPISQV